MTNILFERRPNVYLPEITAYIQYLQAHFSDVKAYDSLSIEDPDPKTYDVVWRFMGSDMKGEGDYVVHEYNSLSTPPFAKFKNSIKKVINKKPNRRVFLNDEVKADFNFKDNVPSSIRDMGVAEEFFVQDPDPEYDFVYVGSVHRGAEVERILEYFAGCARDLRILIVGSISPELRKRFSPHSNIKFAGRVVYEEVPKYMAKGRWGLNLVPLHYPYTHQSATKVLEYCALGMPIVSLQYSWIEQFIEQRGGSVFYLERDYKNLNFNNLENFDFKTPNVEDLRWNNIIQNSGVFDFLNQ